MALRGLLGFASMAVVVVSFVLLVELVSGIWRTVIGILAILPVPLAYIMMAGVGYAWPDWRTTQLVITLPWFLTLTMWWVAYNSLTTCRACDWNQNAHTRQLSSPQLCANRPQLTQYANHHIAGTGCPNRRVGC